MGVQQLGAGALPQGVPQNQSGGVNSNFNPDGSNSISTGTNMTPVNWNTVPHLNGIGAFYWFKCTDTGLVSGTAAALTGASVGFFTNMSSSPSYSIPSGAGARSFSYQISSSASGTPVVASGTGQVNNTI